jgi:hypothetical protein
MLPTRRVEQHLQYVDRDLQDIVMELRSLIVSVAPGVTETIDRHGLVYFHKERGGPVSAGLCRIGIHADHVLLAFIHGAFLPDPMGLLTGPSRYKKHVRIDRYDSAPWDYLRSLLEASNRFDPRTPDVTN